MRRKMFDLPTSPKVGPERAAIYARVSTIKQKGRPDEDDKLSLEDQEIGCRQLCHMRGYVVNEDFVVREVSSGENVHRPLLEEIYAAAKRREIDVLVMYKVNRFARNDDKATYLYGRAVYENHMRIEFVEAPPSEKLERFHFKFKSMFAEEYRDEVKKQTAEKRRERVTKRGLLMPGAWPMFGYNWDHPIKKGRYLVDEEAAAIVRRIFQDAYNGITLRMITFKLNAEEVPTPSVYQKQKGWLPEGRKVSPIWRRGNVYRLLHTPAYWGEHAAYRHAHADVVEQDAVTGKYEQFHHHHLRKPGDPALIPIPPEVCPPIIEKWLAEAAFERLLQNKREAGKPGRSLQAMLRGGYLSCGYCGRPMYVWTPKYPAPPRYHCRWVRDRQEGHEFHGVQACPGKAFTVRHEKLDQAVWQDIVHYFSDPDWLERVLAQERQREEDHASSKEKRVKELDKALASKDAAADHLVQLATKITSAKMREKLQKQINGIGAVIETLEQERASLLVQPESEERRHAQHQALRSWASVARIGLEEDLTVEEKRLVLYWLGAQVRAWYSYDEPNYELLLTWRGLNAGKPLILRERNTDSSV
ncbi:MAG TPA: recombinase family protein [Ktedonobacterales bacterium]|nr:recombinase family protein [Ktedonobacterales bacterium]